MYRDAVFADRIRYQLTMFGIRLLIGLSRLIHAHVACEADGSKIIAALCRISYCLDDLKTVEFNHLPCGKSKMYDDVVFDDGFRYQLTYV